MNTDQVKEKLLQLHGCAEDFTVIFSGKKSKKANGLYKPFLREIIIHDRNFVNDDGWCNENLLFYTAMHELAHHIQDTEYKKKSTRAHTQLFYSILDDLVDVADARNLYRIVIDDDTQKLIEEAQDISCQIAELQRKLGKVITQLNGLCNNQGIRLEDITGRKAQIDLKTVKRSVRAFNLHLPEELGADIQEAAIQERNDDKWAALIRAAQKGKSVTQVKQGVTLPVGGEDKMVSLAKEKRRLERTINSLSRRLEDVEEQLRSMGEERSIKDERIYVL